jgi:hypothetical protein
VVSEDQQRSQGVLPNNALDTEDQIPRDGQLSVTSKNNEDTGVDGLLDAGEIAPASRRDLCHGECQRFQGDDFQNVIDEIDGKKLETSTSAASCSRTARRPRTWTPCRTPRT